MVKKIYSKIIAVMLAITIGIIPVQVYASSKRRNLTIVNPISMMFYNAGDAFQCSIVSNDKSNLEWSISKSNLTQGKVNITPSGRVTSTSNACGTVEVRVRDKNNSDTRTKSFNIEPAVKSITVSKHQKHIYIPDMDKYTPEPLQLQFNPNVKYPWDPCTYESTNMNIAGLAYDGDYTRPVIIPGGEKGTCTITATARYGSGKASFQVTVGEKAPEESKPTPTKPSKPKEPSKPTKPSKNNKNDTVHNKSNNTKEQTTSNKSTNNIPEITKEEVIVSEELEQQVENTQPTTSFDIAPPQVKIDTQDNIKFSWPQIDGVSGYALYIKKDNEYQLVYYGKDNEYNLNNFEYEQNYTVKMKCYLLDGETRLYSNFNEEQSFKTRKLTFKEKIKNYLRNL